MDVWITSRLYPDDSEAIIVARCTADAGVTLTVALVEVFAEEDAELRALEVGAGVVEAQTSPEALGFLSRAMPVAPIQTYPPNASVPGLYLAVAEGERSAEEAVAAVLARGSRQGPGQGALDDLVVDLISGADLWREGGGLPGYSVFCDVSIEPSAGLEARAEDAQTLLTLWNPLVSGNPAPTPDSPPVLVAGPRHGVVLRLAWREDPVDGWHWGTADLSAYGAMAPGTAVVWSVETTQETLRKVRMSRALPGDANTFTLTLPEGERLEFRYRFPPTALVAVRSEEPNGG